MNAKRIFGWACVVAASTFVGGAMAQPTLVPAYTGPELLCAQGPDTAVANFETDTVPSTPDSNGFRSIFDGKSFKGWVQNCFSSHSSNKTTGAIWRVDSVRKAIYAMSRNGVGGLLMTKKKYAHYELLFDWWPQYGNDGGVFNRLLNRAGGVASNQMVLDYLGASGILSYYSENFPQGRNGRPWSYSSENQIAIPGSGGNGGDLSNWTNQTSRRNRITGYGPTDIGCAASGCVQADLLRLWNNDGWMQCRQIYYGGLSATEATSLTAQGDKIREFTFFRKHTPLVDTTSTHEMTVNTDTISNKWVPVVQDSMLLVASDQAIYAKKSWFAFQIHGGNRYIYPNANPPGLGSWYRDIKVRELDSLGNPLAFTSAIENPALNRQVQYDLRAVSGFLVGSMDLDHLVTILDLKGQVLQQYTGFAGRNISRELPKYSGVMLIRVTSMRGTQTLRVDPTAR